jgi:hypothetical protein
VAPERGDQQRSILIRRHLHLDAQAALLKQRIAGDIDAAEDLHQLIAHARFCLEKKDAPGRDSCLIHAYYPFSSLELLEQTEAELRQRRQDQVGGPQTMVVCQRRVGHRDTAHARRFGRDHPIG